MGHDSYTTRAILSKGWPAFFVRRDRLRTAFGISQQATLLIRMVTQREMTLLWRPAEVLARENQGIKKPCRFATTGRAFTGIGSPLALSKDSTQDLAKQTAATLGRLLLLTAAEHLAQNGPQQIAKAAGLCILGGTHQNAGQAAKIQTA